MKSFSFAPITSNDANILILGTMPGTKSLELNQYYGHKQNNFWKFMFTILKEDFSDDYPTKSTFAKKQNSTLGCFTILRTSRKSGQCHKK